MEVSFYATLRQIVGTKTVDFPLPEGATLRQLVAEIVRCYPLMKRELVDENGELHRHIHIFINGRDSTFYEQGIDTPISPQDTIGVFPAVGGGQVLTEITLKFTGDVRTRMGGVDGMNFAFEGETLGELLGAVFSRYPLRDLILDEEGNVRPYSRVILNGRYSDLAGGMAAPVYSGDVVTLIRPYVLAF